MLGGNVNTSCTSSRPITAFDAENWDAVAFCVVTLELVTVPEFTTFPKMTDTIAFDAVTLDDATLHALTDVMRPVSPEMFPNIVAPTMLHAVNSCENALLDVRLLVNTLLDIKLQNVAWVDSNWFVHMLEANVLDVKMSGDITVDAPSWPTTTCENDALLPDMLLPNAFENRMLLVVAAVIHAFDADRLHEYPVCMNAHWIDACSVHTFDARILLLVNIMVDTLDASMLLNVAVTAIKLLNCASRTRSAYRLMALSVTMCASSVPGHSVM